MQLAFGLSGAIVLVLPFAVALSAIDAPPAHAPRGVQVTRQAAAAAVEKSLPLLQASSATWFEQRSCSSCHHQSLGMMAVAVAKERGFVVDTALLRGQFARTLRGSPGALERYVGGDPSINEAIGQSYRLVGLGTAGYASGTLTDAIVRMLEGKQHESGRWSSYSRRPPLEDAEFTATALSIRALSLFADSARDAIAAQRIARGREWLRVATVQSSEDVSMQLLGLAWSGVRPRELTSFAQRALASQRADGGWAQVATRTSDVYATAQILVALNQAAQVPMSDARMQRALRFLVDAQMPDGSWRVHTRRTRGEGLPYFESGYPHGEDQFISYSGAAWATMALTLATREGTSVLIERPARTIVLASDSSELGDVTPLMRAAWRGDVARVRQLLASGSSPRDTTRLGMTALMFGARDVETVRVLLDAGADPNAMSSRDYTPLVIAASYTGADSAVMMLLSRGARVDVAGRSGAFERVSPMIAALMRGDTLLAQRLLERGASVHGPTNATESPLLAASWYGDAAAVRWLLARGAQVHPPRSPVDTSAAPTPLMIAAEDGGVDVARALIDAGARVDDVGPDGYTALQLAAASIDRGSTEIVELLLKAGANANLIAKDGETALTLAKRWGPAGRIAVIEKATRR